MTLAESAPFRLFYFFKANPFTFSVSSPTFYINNKGARSKASFTFTLN